MFNPMSKSAVETRLSILGRFNPENAISYAAREAPASPPRCSSRVCRLKDDPNVGARSRLVAPGDDATSMFSVEFDMSPSTVDTRMPRDSQSTPPGFSTADLSSKRMCVMRSSRLCISRAYRRGRRMRWRFRAISRLGSSPISAHVSLSLSTTFNATCSFDARGTTGGVIAPPGFSRPKDSLRLTSYSGYRPAPAPATYLAGGGLDLSEGTLRRQKAAGP
mmetsp:Transcript_14626/g.57491  ORF Transcript_14626/g.57491 Transcript_14626/m.57491 type:complete len:220 (-) Transcript_14626:63-722(-)